MSAGAPGPSDAPRSPGTAFGDRLAAVLSDLGPLCVGIDPHPGLLDSWGLPQSAGGVREFGLRVVDAARGRVGILKPQVAFFERWGSAGYAALEQVIAAARAAGILVIADVKRGDVDTSVAAYGEAWLGLGSALEVDAMTAVAYQGVESLAAPLALAESNGKGIFVLAVTSNPEAAPVQTARLDVDDQLGESRAGDETQPLTVAADVVRRVAEFNDQQSAHALGSIGVVLGATADLPRYGIELDRRISKNAFPVLAPGFGFQGADVQDSRRIFGEMVHRTIVSESRSVLGAGPDELGLRITERAEGAKRIRG